jgi:hypothetical protein
LVIVLAVAVGGLVAQLLIGPRPGDWPSWPTNLYILAVIVILAAATKLSRWSRFLSFFYSLPLAVALMGAIGFLALVMGLVPQLALGTAPPESLWGRLGLFQVTSSWPFSFLYLLTLVALGATVFRWPRKKWAAFLNHLGLWLLLSAAGLGAGDRERGVMRVREGALEWRAMTSKGVKELDLAIRLDDFILEEYPARLALVDAHSGQALPMEKDSLAFSIDPSLTLSLSPSHLGSSLASGRIGDYFVEVLQFFSKAAPMGEGKFIRAIYQGSVQAALVRAKNSLSGESFEGWLTPGNSTFPPNPLRLGKSNQILAMVRPEPRLFVSKVKIYTKQGQEIESTILVNHPLRAGSWLIYQYDYDTAAGQASSWSGFELTRDPWLDLAYVGFILWGLGCLGLVLRNAKGKSS